MMGYIKRIALYMSVFLLIIFIVGCRNMKDEQKKKNKQIKQIQKKNKSKRVLRKH